MADTFAWGIAQLERKLSDGVVYTAHWTVTATREVTGGDDLTAGSYGSIGFGAITSSDTVTLTTVPFFRNTTTIASNYTVTTTYNEMSIGPITINSGITVTVNSGATWTVV